MDLNQLNRKQREAVLKTDGPLLILAGAGSGKTRVLTSKIAYLIKEKNIDENQILAFTFTNKAAKEMKDRVGNLLNKNIDHMWVGTFHSICSRILRRNIDNLGYKNNFTIYDTTDQRTLIKDIIKELNYSEDYLTPMSVISSISDYKNRFIHYDKIIDSGEFSRDKQIGEIYKIYEKKKKENNALDFDDLILKTIELLEEKENIRSYYSRKFEYVFVDEYQDTNKSQYKLIQLLTSYHKNICVVGDADQSIYGWRGADISNILNFEEDFKNTSTILLEQNYRSSQNILDAANKLIELNSERKEKNLWTENDAGKPIIYKELQNEYAEGDEVINWILQMRNEGYKFKDMAILYRTNAQSRIFEEKLMYEGIPHKVIGGLKFYDRKEVKDIIAYLNVLVNPDDNLSLKRIINTPKRGIGAVTLSKIEDYADSRGTSIYDSIYNEDIEDFLPKGAVKKLREFSKIMDEISLEMENSSLEEIVKGVFHISGYYEHLKSSNTIEDRSRIENIESLINAVAEYEKMNPEARLEEYLQNVSLLSDVDKTEEARGISLMTIHAAKGLEYDVVFLTGLEEGLFPSKRSLEEGGIEEERRLCYVAVTRAKERLFMSSAGSRMVYGQNNLSMKSSFLTEMEGMYENKSSQSSMVMDYDSYDFSFLEQKRSHYRKKIIKDRKSRQNSTAEYRIGDKVEHKRFGLGTIVQLEGESGNQDLLIAFDGQGIKRLNSALAPLKKR